MSNEHAEDGGIMEQLGTTEAFIELCVNPGSILAFSFLIVMFGIIIVASRRRHRPHEDYFHDIATHPVKDFLDFAVAAHHLEITEEFALRYTRFTERPEYPCLSKGLSITRRGGKYVILADDVEIFVKRLIDFWEHDKIDGGNTMDEMIARTP